jgi:secreted trypsin-like serine protease
MTKQIPSLLLGGLLALTACQAQNSGTRVPSSVTASGIIGGTAVASDSDIGHHTVLLIDTARGAMCTASILNSRWLITAAHCVSGADLGSLVIGFDGSLDHLMSHVSRANARLVEKAVVQPRYAETQAKLAALQKAATDAGRNFDQSELDQVKDWGDLALVKIDQELPLPYTPATLLSPAETLVKGQIVALAGYGRTGSSDDTPSGNLMQVDVPVGDPMWGSSEVLTNQTQGKGACHGDSGGPAYARVGGMLQLFGVTSRGMGDHSGDECVHSGVYTNINAYRAWVDATIAL